MRLGFLFAYIVVMWSLIVGGSFILIKIIGPLQLEAGEFLTAVFKAVVAFLMVAVWLAILVVIKNSYVQRKLSLGS